MYRCLELAKLGAGNVAPNPMVGAVLLHAGRIIGEGYHEQYGQAHAEVNCINSVSEADMGLIEKSILYVSLEPCVHFGKTPPCTDLIIAKKIPNVVIACRDNYREVDGKGIQKLLSGGIQVITGVLEKEAIELNKRFFTFHTQHRPYIILKWAQSCDNKIANIDFSRVFISNEQSNRLVHKWRSEEAAVLAGTNTALHDDPSLTTRLWPGNNPVRLVVDMELKLPGTLRIFDGVAKTIVFNQLKEEEGSKISWYKLLAGKSIIPQITNALYKLNIQSVIVEGGAKLLQSFIDENCWDEARIIINDQLLTGKGISAPVLNAGTLISTHKILSDRITIYRRAM